LSWKCHFDEPIVLPDGGQIVTLEDAGNYITMLPKADQQLDEWQAAIEALMLVVTLGGPTMSARIGVMRALNRNVDHEHITLAKTADHASQLFPVRFRSRDLLPENFGAASSLQLGDLRRQRLPVRRYPRVTQVRNFCLHFRT
jgi:hypothetical protein